MKRFFLIILIFQGIWCSDLVAKALFTPVFSYNAVGKPVANSKYLKIFTLGREYDYMRTLKTFSCALATQDKSGKYTISLSRYEENADDSEVYNLISVYPDGAAKPYVLKQADAWEKLPDDLRKYAANEYFITIPLKDNAVALLFIGRAYANDPHQLTILVMSKSYVCTVYNRLANITEIRPATATASFSLKGEAWGISFTIKNENGILKINE